MKIFWDAGLKEVAKLAHKNITLQSLASCSNFERTHRFLMQVHKAIFMCQLTSFLDHRKGTSNEGLKNDEFLQRIQTVLSHISFDSQYNDMSEFHEAELQFLSGLLTFLEEFDTFC